MLAVAALVTMAACADDGVVPSELVDLVTGGGGTGPATAVVLDNPAAMEELTAAFALTADLAEDVQAAVRAAEIPDGSVLLGGVASRSCGIPTDAEVRRTGSGLVLTGTGFGEVPEECAGLFVTVALVTVDADAVD